MSYYIARPYCGDDQEIDNDGYSYDVGTKYQQECTCCERNFAYKATISISYDALYAAKKKKSKASRKKEKHILQGWV